MANILELARMSSAVYNDNDAETKKQRSILEGSKWQIAQSNTSSAFNGFECALIVKGADKVLAFRGTTINLADFSSDWSLGTGQNTPYFAQGVAFARRLNPTIVTGHSLGGAIAQVVANRCGIPMASFNAPGVGVLASRNIGESTSAMNIIRIVGMIKSAVEAPMQAIEDIANATNKVAGINIRLQGDPVSKFGNHYGKVRMISGSGHGIGNVISVLSGSNYSNLAKSKPTSV